MSNIMRSSLIWSVKQLNHVTGFDFEETGISGIKWLIIDEWECMVICYDEDRPLDQVGYYNTGFVDKNLQGMPFTLVSRLIDIGIGESK